MRCDATSRSVSLLDWHGRLIAREALARWTTRSNAASPQFSVRRPRNNLSVPTIPRHLLQENGGSADQRYPDDGDMLCRPLFLPIYKPSMQPTLKLEQNETHRNQKSSTTWQIWVQLPLIGTSVVFACSFRSPRLFTYTSHRELLWCYPWQKRTSSVLCMNSYSSAMIHRQFFLRELWRQKNQPAFQVARSRNLSRNRSRPHL